MSFKKITKRKPRQKKHKKEYFQSKEKKKRLSVETIITNIERKLGKIYMVMVYNLRNPLKLSVIDGRKLLTIFIYNSQ